MVWMMFSGLILVLVVGLAIVALFVQKKRLDKDYFEEDWNSKGIGIGVALGIPIGVAMDNIGVGIAIGVAIGAAIGSSMRKKHRKRVKLTNDLRRRIWRNTVIMTTTLILGVLVFALWAYLYG